ncbi:MAG: hypothetical protein RL557_340 [archaeon]|jgi:glucosamine--fructose-6-phosphate aminotransferase (isomerizing)
MCGIIGYKGKERALPKILDCLQRLEYRGYDSWGIAVQSDTIQIMKQTGKISDVALTDISLPNSFVGIGHTRWATSGKVNAINAHPHSATDKSFVLAHNGIVENYKQLKDELLHKGYTFDSETDTEVIVRLIEDSPSSTHFRAAIQSAFKKLKGRNTIIILRENSEMYAVRNGSPLVVGFDDTEIYVSSDTLSFAPYVKKIIAVDDGQLIHVGESVTFYDLSLDTEVNPHIEDLNIPKDSINKEGFDHFMIKEIYENPYVVSQVINQEKEQYTALAAAIKKAKNVYTIGSGTAGLAAAQIAYYLRAFGNVKAVSLVGGDARDYFNFFNNDDILIAPSQSGETADVLEVLEFAKSRNATIASYVNMPGSAMTRLSDFKFMARAGPEICVMSTKIFVSQIAWGYLLAKTVEGKFEEGKNNLQSLVKDLSDYLSHKESTAHIKRIAQQLTESRDIFLMGNAEHTHIAHEGMIKIIEGTYKHAHSIPAGDLKHYAITLMEEAVPVIALVGQNKAQSDIFNAVSEVKARGANVIAIAHEDNELFDQCITIPHSDEVSALVTVTCLQLLAYYMTVELGNNVDKPRNIAKSVTVK